MDANEDNVTFSPYLSYSSIYDASSVRFPSNCTLQAGRLVSRLDAGFLGNALTVFSPRGTYTHENTQRSENALKDIMEFSITTKQSDLGWGTGPKDAVRYLPAPDAKQMYLYKSIKTGRQTWMQVTVRSGHEDYRGKVSFSPLYGSKTFLY